LSRISFLQSEALLAHAPDPGSMLYWPALAALGDMPALAGVIAASVLLLGLSIVLFAPRFGNHAIAAAGVSHTVTRQRRWSCGFRTANPTRALRRKEWTLLLRDPWLMSQTLMQMLYLLPPAFLLWRSFEGGGALLVLVPVLVMAAGGFPGSPSRARTRPIWWRPHPSRQARSCARKSRR
jgi:ABC-2 type transport system permease protein